MLLLVNHHADACTAPGQPLLRSYSLALQLVSCPSQWRDHSQPLPSPRGVLPRTARAENLLAQWTPPLHDGVTGGVSTRPGLHVVMRTVYTLPWQTPIAPLKVLLGYPYIDGNQPAAHAWRRYSCSLCCRHATYLCRPSTSLVARIRTGRSCKTAVRSRVDLAAVAC